MFVLTTISDLIQIQANELSKPKSEALEDNINAKYANRILTNTGLCICLWDVLRASEGFIGQGDGTVNVNLQFRLVVFRPYKGEILQGIILESHSPDGLRIGLDFFADVWIPAMNLPQPATLADTEEGEKVWMWDPNSDPDNAFWFDKNEIVRFRVEEEIWSDASPERPDFASNVNGDATIRQHIQESGGSDRKKDEKVEAMKRQVPYAIRGSMAAAGLGIVDWWRNGGGAEDDGEGEEGDVEAEAEDVMDEG